MDNSNELELLSRHRVAKLLKCAPKTLDGLIASGVVPAPMYFGSRQRWERAALIAHIEKRAAEARAA